MNTRNSAFEAWHRAEFPNDPLVWDDLHGYVRESARNRLAGWIAAYDMQQAQIDRLMLEFCPDEMTPSQRKRWAESQRIA